MPKSTELKQETVTATAQAQTATAPVQTATAPVQTAAAPAQTAAAPTQTATAPVQTVTAPVQTATASVQTATAPSYALPQPIQGQALQINIFSKDGKSTNGISFNTKQTVASLNPHNKEENNFLSHLVFYLAVAKLINEGVQEIPLAFHISRQLDLIGWKYTDLLEVKRASTPIIQVPYRKGALNIARFFTNEEAFKQSIEEAKGSVISPN